MHHIQRGHILLLGMLLDLVQLRSSGMCLGGNNKYLLPTWYHSAQGHGLNATCVQYLRVVPTQLQVARVEPIVTLPEQWLATVPSGGGVL